MIGLKRKRSGSDTQTLSSSSSLQFIKLNACSPTPTVSRSLCPSRTQKRHRNSRPSDSEVFGHTLSLLFSAQRNAQTHSKNLSAQVKPESSSSLLPPLHQSKGQSFLSSFWNISAKRDAPCPKTNSIFFAGDILSSKTIPRTPLQTTTACEDCGKNLCDDNVMAANFEDEDHRCSNCGKYVCGSCSINYIDMEKKCLKCVR